MTVLCGEVQRSTDRVTSGSGERTEFEAERQDEKDVIPSLGRSSHCLGFQILRFQTYTITREYLRD